MNEDNNMFLWNDPVGAVDYSDYATPQEDIVTTPVPQISSSAILFNSGVIPKNPLLVQEQPIITSPSSTVIPNENVDITQNAPPTQRRRRKSPDYTDNSIDKEATRQRLRKNEKNYRKGMHELFMELGRLTGTEKESRRVILEAAINKLSKIKSEPNTKY